MTVKLDDSTVKTIFKYFFICLATVILGSILIYFYFHSDKEIRYEDNGSKKIELSGK
jgi:hypothetical protein